MQLMTFGCSLTQICGVTDFFQTVFDLQDFSESAGSNQLQIQRYRDFAAANDISPDSIILYQITGLDRPWARLSRLMFHANPDYYVPKLPQNHYCYVENHDTVDLLCNAKFDHVNPSMITCRDLLDFLGEVNQHHHLIVWFGHKGFVESNYAEISKYLEQNHVVTCQEFFTQWCWDNQLPFLDDLHPAPESGQLYAQQCLLPLINQVMHG